MTTIRSTMFIALALVCASSLYAEGKPHVPPIVEWPPKLSGYVRADASYQSALLDNVGRNDDVNALLELDYAQSLEWKGFIGSVRADMDISGDGGTNVAFLEQGYLMLTRNDLSSLCMRMGSFNAPIGWENQDAPDKFQVTRSLLANSGTPSNLTGFDIGATPTIGNTPFSLRAFAVNGWDKQSDNNHDKSFGARFDITPIEGCAFALVGMWGPEKDTNTRDARSLFDAMLTLSFGSSLTLGLETLYGTEEVSAGKDDRWYGAQATLHSTFVRADDSAGYVNNELYGWTLRCSILRDPDGLMTGKGRTLSEGTAALMTQPLPNFFLRGEVRVDFSSPDDDFFTYADKSATENSAVRVGFEAYCTF